MRRLCLEFDALVLYSLEYDVLFLNGSLRWSKVVVVKSEGTLWQVGQSDALFAQELAERRAHERQAKKLDKLRRADLVASKGSGGTRGRGASSGRGGARRTVSSRGMGVARGRAPLHSTGGSEQSYQYMQPLPLSGQAEESTETQGAAGAEPDRLVDLSGPSSLTDDANLDFDGFDMEAQLEAMLEPSDLEELGATFGASADLQGPRSAETPSGRPFDDAGDEVSAELQAAMESANDLANSLMEEAVGGGTSASSSGAARDGTGPQDVEVMAPPPAEPSLRDRFGLVGPSSTGYVTSEGRLCVRIQRGKPKGSVSIRCYRHRNCSLLLTERLALGDDDLLEWAFSVEATGPELSLEESQALTASEEGGSFQL